MCPESYTHSLRDLLRVAGLEKARDERAQRDVAFDDNWEYVLLWSEKSRYQTMDALSARSLIHAVADRTQGVLAWIKLHW